MFRNIFKEPKPGNRAELISTADELGLDPSTCAVVLEDYTGLNDAPYDGWCAEVTGEADDGDTKTFDTIAWVSEEAARNDLEAAGFTI